MYTARRQNPRNVFINTELQKRTKIKGQKVCKKNGTCTNPVMWFFHAGRYFHD